MTENIVENAQIETNHIIQVAPGDIPVNIENPSPWSGYFKTALEICNEEIQMDEYLIEPLIVKGACNAIVGGSGVGKSTILRQLSLAIVNGDTSVLGFKINATQNKVIYCSTEDTQYQWKKQLLAFKAGGISNEALSRLYLIFECADDLISAVESKLKSEKVDLIIADVYSDIYTGDPNNNILVRSFIKRFKNLSYSYGVTPLFVHHNGKGTEKSAPSKNSVLGSQGFESSMRSLIELRADQYDSAKRHLCLLKQNYLCEADKKQSYILQLNDDLTFSNTGDRRDLAFLAQTTQKVVHDDGMIQRILELSNTGLPCRAIEQNLKEQGFQIGKTRINEIINANKHLPQVHEERAVESNLETGIVVQMNAVAQNNLFDSPGFDNDLSNEDSG